MGAILPHNKTIGGCDYLLTNLSATDACEALEMLMGGIDAGLTRASLKETIDTFVRLAPGGVKALLDLEVSDIAGPLLGEVVPFAVKLLADKNIYRLMRYMFRTLHRDNRPCDFNQEFTGELNKMTLVFIWALQVNFSSFFPAGPAREAILQHLKAKA